MRDRERVINHAYAARSRRKTSRKHPRLEAARHRKPSLANPRNDRKSAISRLIARTVSNMEFPVSRGDSFPRPRFETGPTCRRKRNFIREQTGIASCTFDSPESYRILTGRARPKVTGRTVVSRRDHYASSVLTLRRLSLPSLAALYTTLLKSIFTYSDQNHVVTRPPWPPSSLRVERARIPLVVVVSTPNDR